MSGEAFGGDDLTIDAGDGARVRLREVQAVIGRVIGLALELVPEEERQAAAEAFARRLDDLAAAARPALPGERVLTGADADAAARAALRDAIDERRHGGGLEA